jgi:hypothetical protein
MIQIGSQPLIQTGIVRGALRAGGSVLLALLAVSIDLSTGARLAE